MERSKSRFTVYAFAALALVMIVVHLWPRLFVGFTSGSSILPLGPSGEGYYLAPIQQTRLGRTNFNHSIYYELKDVPDKPAMEANIRAFAWLANHTGLSFFTFTSVLYAVCVVVLVALFGWVFYRQTANGIWTIAFTATAILAPDYLVLRAHPFNEIINWLHLPLDPDLLGTYLPYMRPMNPQASSIILLFLCGVLSSFLPVGPGEKPRSGLFMFVAGLIGVVIALVLALAIHTYYYLAIYCITVLGLLTLVTLWRKEFRYLSVPVGAGWAAGVILSLPFILNLMGQVSGDLALDPSAIINAVRTHLPTATLAGIICLLTGLYLLREVEAGDTRAVFPMILNLAVPFAENAHIVTGVMIEPFQVGWFYGPPALVAAAAWWVGSQADLRDEAFWGLRSSLAVMSMAVMLGGVQLRYSMQTDFTRFGEERDLAPVFSLTVPMDDGECVVMASEHVSDLVRLYTPCRVYGQFTGVRGTGPASRNLDRLQRMASVFGISWPKVMENPANWQGWGGRKAAGYLVGPRAFGHLFMWRRPLESAELDAFRAQYDSANSDCIGSRDPFRLDYVITLGDEDAYLRPARFCQEIELLGRSGAARVYRVTDRKR